MAGYEGIKREDFSRELTIAFSNIKSAQLGMNKLVASVIYIALVDERNRGMEANELLQQLEMYRPGESVILRRYLLQFGPFVKADDKSVTIDGDLVAVKYAVKYSEARHKAEFMAARPEDYYARSVMNTYFTYVILAGKEKKAKEKKEKSKEEKLVDLKAKLLKIKAAAEEEGITLEVFQDVMPKPAYNPTVPNMPELTRIMESMLKEAEFFKPADVAKLTAAHAVLITNKEAVSAVAKVA